MEWKDRLLFAYDLQWFAKDGPGGEKTEPATEKKLREAREDGKVAKSKELTAAFDLIVLFLVLKVFISLIGNGFLEVFYYVYKLIMKAAHGIKGSQTVALWVAGIAGAMTNTLLVMNGIYIFFGQSYAAASNKAVEHIYDVILGIILGFGIPEAIVAGILTTAITKVLFKIMKDNG